MQAVPYQCREWVLFAGIGVGRPAEAVPLIQAVLRGGIQGSGLYLTRTETHELLAHAFEAQESFPSTREHRRGCDERRVRDA